MDLFAISAQKTVTGTYWEKMSHVVHNFELYGCWTATRDDGRLRVQTTGRQFAWEYTVFYKQSTWTSVCFVRLLLSFSEKPWQCSTTCVRAVGDTGKLVATTVCTRLNALCGRVRGVRQPVSCPAARRNVAFSWDRTVLPPPLISCVTLRKRAGAVRSVAAEIDRCQPGQRSRARARAPARTTVATTQCYPGFRPVIIPLRHRTPSPTQDYQATGPIWRPARAPHNTPYVPYVTYVGGELQQNPVENKFYWKNFVDKF